MRENDKTTAASGLGALTHGGEGSLSRAFARARRAMAKSVANAWAHEQAWRRPILWAPVGAGTGAILFFSAETEPSLLVVGIVFALTAGASYGLRAHRAFVLVFAIACIFGGMFSAGLRSARVCAPVLSFPMTAALTAYVEQIDHRALGARLVLRVVSIDRLSRDETPFRIRVTTRRDIEVSPGMLVSLKARLLPPAHASSPGGYDFARDAFFARIGAVGNVLGKIDARASLENAAFSLRFYAMIDRFRNALTLRIAQKLEGDSGAIAAAMVAGKRDFLTSEARETIREAGVFHIITISGVQMTLVAGIFFVGLRRAMALSQTLALHFPIKKWAAVLAIFGAIAYDIATGSRVGTERALVMTVIFLGAALVDRVSISMRNLALAACFVIAFEPEAILGSSFQLSFAAVAALVAVWEARGLAVERARQGLIQPSERFGAFWTWLSQARWRGVGAALFATFCATLATSSFMAANFHELSPYALIGNPLTLAMIEFFAVPAALLGTLLYPLGWDGPVWFYLGYGVELVMGFAKILARAPSATVHLREFAPWSLPFLALGVLNCVIWRTNTFRLLAAPFWAIGLVGAFLGPRYDLIVAPSGDVFAARKSDGSLTILGKKNDFATEQWLRADGDSRAPSDAHGRSCDKLGCVAILRNGVKVAMAKDPEGLIEDCRRADIVIADFFAPDGCVANMVIDKRVLLQEGAIALSFDGDKIIRRSSRLAGEDRPWSTAPRLRKERKAPDDDADSAEPQTIWDSLD